MCTNPLQMNLNLADLITEVGRKKTLLQNTIVSGTICLKLSDPLQFRLHIIRLSFGETFLFLTLSTK